MPLYTPDDPEFAALEARHRWFDAVLQAECGELLGDEDGAPAALNWLDLVPPSRALDLVADCEDVSALALDLGFSSHSHFTAAFRQAYGRTPTGFRRAALAKRT